MKVICCFLRLILRVTVKLGAKTEETNGMCSNKINSQEKVPLSNQQHFCTIYIDVENYIKIKLF